jgi:hypothetical protein
MRSSIVTGAPFRASGFALAHQNAQAFAALKQAAARAIPEPVELIVLYARQARMPLTINEE